MPKPAWQLPAGVTRGVWDYSQTGELAENEDAYFAEHPLFDFDAQVLRRYFEPPGVVADLGCGAGRALLPLVRRGLSAIAIDLSQSMLEAVRRKADRLRSEAAEERKAAWGEVECLRANLVDLDCLADNSVDYAMCLFSTLGMIRGAGERLKALRHVRRILKPRGVFVLHVHNYYYNLWDPEGPWWFLDNWQRSWWDSATEAGDKYFLYRGIPNMFLHVFTAGELAGALAEADFAVREWLPLDGALRGALPWPWLLGSLRASGWVVVCE